MAGEIEAADRAAVVDLEKRTKEATAPAARAPSSNAPPKGEANVTPGGSLCRRPVVVVTSNRAFNRRGHRSSSCLTRQHSIRRRRPSVIKRGHVVDNRRDHDGPRAYCF